MSTSQKRDADMDRLLRAVLKPAPQGGADDCPDAGALAAFVEGELTGAEQSVLDAHVATCGRCQEALAILSQGPPLGEVEEAVAPAETGWFTWVTRPRLRWLVPISALATVAVVFFATRPLIAPEGELPGPDVIQMAQAPAPPTASTATGVDTLRETSAAAAAKGASADQPERREAPRSLASAPPPAKGETGEAADRQAAGNLARDKKTAEPAAQMTAARVASEEQRMPSAAPPAAAPPPAAGQAAVAQQVPSVLVAADAARKQTAAELARAAPATALRREAQILEARDVTVSAPGGIVRWRFGAGGRLARSGDAGDTWHEQASGVTSDLLAGAAPSPATCWIVGASGTVLLTTDGEHWERRPFIQAADLVAVTASSARAAIVTARDGRRFETLDTGLTWSPKQ